MASLAFLITQRGGEPSPKVSDASELTAHLKAVNKRLKTLEGEANQLRLEQQRTAQGQRRVIAKNTPRDVRSAGGVQAQAGDQVAPSQRAQRQLPKTDNSPTAWNPPAFEDGHVFDDGVMVNMNPEVPAAKDPIPASAQVSQDDGAEMKAAFPQGCPTCE